MIQKLCKAYRECIALEKHYLKLPFTYKSFVSDYIIQIFLSVCVCVFLFFFSFAFNINQSTFGSTNDCYFAIGTLK